jgi:hypothetical protein
MKSPPLRSQHPSGRPLRRDIKPKRSEPVWRSPLEQPATPRLRPDKMPHADAIGFKVLPRQDW